MGREDLLFRVQPVGSGHGDGDRRDEEQLVHILEEGGVGVDGQHAVVLGLIESKQFREGIGPGFWIQISGQLSFPSLASKFLQLGSGAGILTFVIVLVLYSDRHKLHTIVVASFEK